VEDSREMQEILRALNSIFLTLIPKEERANSVDKFKLILLYNVIYKIISMVIANRLNPIMSRITSPEQGGYTKG
jgi:hypothetical protein